MNLIEQCRTEAAENPVAKGDLPPHSRKEIGIPQSIISIILDLRKPRERETRPLTPQERMMEDGAQLQRELD